MSGLERNLKYLWNLSQQEITKSLETEFDKPNLTYSLQPDFKIHDVVNHPGTKSQKTDINHTQSIPLLPTLEWLVSLNSWYLQRTETGKICHNISSFTTPVSYTTRVIPSESYAAEPPKNNLQHALVMMSKHLTGHHTRELATPHVVVVETPHKPWTTISSCSSTPPC